MVMCIILTDTGLVKETIIKFDEYDYLDYKCPKEGEITEEEFDIAYNSLKENRHPDIFVYVRKRSPFSLRNIFGDRRLQNIKNKIFAYQKEYYIEYENLENLRYLFYSDMVTYFQK
mgnify:CR=1 FL=1